MTGDPDIADCEDCLRAIDLGRRALAAGRPEGGPFKLVAAVNRLKGAPSRGPDIWQLIFKEKQLIPADDLGAVGAGGEWSVRVDLARPGDPPRVTRED